VQRWRRGPLDEESEHEGYLPEEGGLTKEEERFLTFASTGEEEERFLSAQADAFAGANAEEKASARSVRNDGWAVWSPEKVGSLRSK
jgi:hypothetical protein